MKAILVNDDRSLRCEITLGKELSSSGGFGMDFDFDQTLIQGNILGFLLLW